MANELLLQMGTRDSNWWLAGKSRVARAFSRLDGGRPLLNFVFDSDRALG